MPNRGHKFTFPVLVASFLGAWATMSSACPVASGETATVSAVETGYELRLTDGRLLRIAGVESALPSASSTVERDGGRALSEWLSGREVAIEAVEPPDRWGRIAAHVAAPVGGAPFSVAFALIDAGFALARPEAAIRRCWAELLRFEQAARRTGAGSWKQGEFRVLSAFAPGEFAASSGRFVIAEGRIRTVNPTPARTYLNFGPRRGVDFVVTIPRQAVRTFERSGTDPKSFAGRLVRVRGLLETAFGPSLEVLIPEAIEVLAEPPRTRQASP